jgi:hypothetical protein
MAPLLPIRSKLCVYISTVVSMRCTRWVQTFPHRAPGASPATPSSTGNHIMGKLQAAEHSSGALVPFRDSSGSHCLLRAWVKLNSHTRSAKFGIS